MFTNATIARRRLAAAIAITVTAAAAATPAADAQEKTITGNVTDITGPYAFTPSASPASAYFGLGDLGTFWVTSRP